MRLLSKSLAGFSLSCSLLLSACANSEVKPWTPDRTVGVMVLRNPDPESPPPYFISYEAVTFDNTASMALWTALNGSSSTGLGISSANLNTRCFKSGVCLLFNLIPGRYHVSGFGYLYTDNSREFYNMSGPKVREISTSQAVAAMFNGKYEGDVFNASDLYFVVAPGSTGFAGSYRWSKNPQGPLARLFQIGGSFAFERDTNGLDERSALAMLMKDVEFTKNKSYVDWVPVVQRRLDRLSRPALVTGTCSTSNPSDRSARAASKTDGCSVAPTRMCFLPDLARSRAIPLTARLFASVAPDVKISSWGAIPHSVARP